MLAITITVGLAKTGQRLLFTMLHGAVFTMRIVGRLLFYFRLVYAPLPLARNTCAEDDKYFLWLSTSMLLDLVAP